MADWRSEEFYKERRDELEAGWPGKSLEHSLRRGRRRPRRWLASTGPIRIAARVAGLRGQGYDDPASPARADELDGNRRRASCPESCTATAAVALGHAFPELPPKVLAAVERHTLGAVDMSDLDMIVYIADALEPGRKGKMVQKLREKVGELELRADLFPWRCTPTVSSSSWSGATLCTPRPPRYGTPTCPSRKVYRAEANPPGTFTGDLSLKEGNVGEPEGGARRP